MKFRSFAVGIAAATLLASAPAHAEWLETKSKHFTVYGDMPEAQLRERTQRLETFDAALRGLFNVKTDDMATIYIVESMDAVQKLAGNSRVGGFYQAHAQGALGVVPEKLPDYIRNMKPEQILFHEYTHHMLLSNTSQFFPGWVTEGLAELFMSVKIDKNGSAIIGEPNLNRANTIGGMSRWTVRRLIESDARPPKGEERLELYSRGWLMCHYLLISGNRPGQFFKYIDAINAGAPPLQAAEQVFGDLNALDTEIERYVRAAKFPSSVIASDKMNVDLSISLRKLTAGENAILPYRLTSAVGVNEKTARPLADKARPVGSRFLDDAFVQRAMAEIEYDAKNYDAAETAANRVLAVDPNNVMAYAYKGRVMVQRALLSKDANQWKEARRLILQANRLSPDFALPFLLFYDSYVAAGITPPAGAATGIRRAVVLVPADNSLRVRAGVELIRAGEFSTARTVLAPIAFDPHGKDDNDFAKLVKLMDEGATKEALLAKITELKFDRLNEFNPPKPDEDKNKEDKPKKP